MELSSLLTKKKKNSIETALHSPFRKAWAQSFSLRSSLWNLLNLLHSSAALPTSPRRPPSILLADAGSPEGQSPRQAREPGGTLTEHGPPEGEVRECRRDWVTSQRQSGQTTPSPETRGINIINYGSSKSSCDTIYIPRPSKRKKPTRPFLSDSISTSPSVPRGFLFTKRDPNTAERASANRERKDKGGKSVDRDNLHTTSIMECGHRLQPLTTVSSRGSAH